MTETSRHSNLLAKPEAPHSWSGSNNLAKLSYHLRGCLSGAHCCDSPRFQQLREMLGQTTQAGVCAAAAALPRHSEKGPVTQTQRGLAPPTLGQTHHPWHRSLYAGVKHHSLLWSHIRYSCKASQLSREGLTWHFGTVSAGCDHTCCLQSQSHQYFISVSNPCSPPLPIHLPGPSHTPSPPQSPWYPLSQQRCQVVSFIDPPFGQGHQWPPLRWWRGLAEIAVFCSAFHCSQRVHVGWYFGCVHTDLLV